MAHAGVTPCCVERSRCKQKKRPHSAPISHGPYDLLAHPVAARAYLHRLVHHHSHVVEVISSGRAQSDLDVGGLRGRNFDWRCTHVRRTCSVVSTVPSEQLSQKRDLDNESLTYQLAVSPTVYCKCFPIGCSLKGKRGGRKSVRTFGRPYVRTYARSGTEDGWGLRLRTYVRT